MFHTGEHIIFHRVILDPESFVVNEKVDATSRYTKHFTRGTWVQWQVTETTQVSDNDKCKCLFL
jgi:hypothetical protein